MYNAYIRDYHKHRLQCKYNWLLRKYYTYKAFSVNTFERPQKSVPPEDIVTVLNVDEHPIELNQNEVSLLCLGPGFAVTPKIDEKLVHNIEVNLAQCAYNMKWKKTIENNESNSYEFSTYSKLKKSRPKIQTPFISTPPTIGTDIDVMMKNLSFVTDTIKNSDIKPNLNKCQLAALKSIRNRDNLYIAESDKCGDFVVPSANAYKSLAIQLIKSNVDVYKWIPPTRQINGESRQVKCHSEITYKLQINNKRDLIESQCNTTWREIVNERGIEKRTAALFFSHNTILPTLYTLLKTHKIPPEVNISTKKKDWKN